MILIKKNPEPREWLKYRSPSGVDYPSIPELVDSNGNVISFVDEAVYEITLNNGLEIYVLFKASASDIFFTSLIFNI